MLTNSYNHSYSKKSFYFHRTGYGYRVELRSSGVIVKTDMVIGHTKKAIIKLKKLAEEWTGQEWDISYFNIKRGYQHLQT